MQNFSNSPAPPSIPPGFSGRGVGGAPYPPQPAEPQISPRMTDDYAGMQQQSLHRGHHHPGQASHMLAYSARNRGAGEPPPSQSNIHSGSGNNPYRKDAMDYYFSMGGKDRHRRGGMSYGGGFGYPTIDGHIPHQYRHPGSSSAPSSGLMSPYPVDYGSGAASGGGAGAFSPSHQYSMNQNPAMQSVPGSQMHRQHGQTFPVHHGQQHRSYTHSGHRMTPQYPHFSPQGGASTGSSGMYSPPPQRYIDGAASTGFDPKVNSSPSVNSSSNSISSSVAANNVGPMENVQQSYHAANYHVYSPQSHSLHKQATLQHRNSQHGLGVGYDGSLKMQHQGPSPGSVYAKHQASAPSIPQPASQELAKSPMHPNAQQTPMNQNFSPISNPSPVASAVHSPSCSSSPSPLMGVPEAHGNPSGHGPSHPPPSNPRSSHGHGRLLQTMPQLSPTPNSNSSISSCGSSGSHKAHNPVGGSSLPTSGRNKVGHGGGIGSREEGLSVYSTPSLDKMQDAGLNSLNALSSQVANLPNTIQHMLLTDSVLSQKRKDGGQTQQAAHGVPLPQPRSRNASAASSTSTVKDGGAVGIGDGASLDVVADEDFSLMASGGSSGTKGDREDQFSEGEHGRVRQMSGASSESEAAGFNQTQTQTERASSVKSVASDSPSKDTVATETKRKEAHIPLPSSSSSSSSPSFGYQSSETGPVTHPAPPVSLSPSFTPSSIPPPQPNCTPETGLTFNDDRAGERKPPDVKKEGDAAAEKTQKVSTQQDGEADTQNGQDKENRFVSETKPHNYKREDKHASEEQQNSSNVGVIVSARSEGAQAEKNKHPQDNCVEEKQPHSHSRESSSHNGEEGVDLSMCSPQRQKSKPGRSQNPQPPGSHKYSYSDSTYGSDLSMKNRVRAGPKGVTDSNARFLGYQQSQTGYAHPKDAGGPAVDTLPKRSQGEGSKGQEENSQMQQFPSLLQEVLQGYNLDRRYGRPEQAYPAHHHVHQQFPNRLAFGMTESGRIQSAVPEVSAHSAQMGSSGKPPNQKDGSEPDFPADLQSAMKSELPNAKMYQNADKTEVGVSQSHLPQATESQEPPPKHINLADFSLPQKKGSANASNLSSAVQELLLQEPEPLTGTTGQTEPQKSSGSMLVSSERRSVICDVSPNRRSTPERDRERDRDREKSQSGASVIQQPFSSPAAGSDKKDPGEKHMIKTEMPSKEAGANAAHIQAKHHGISGVNEPDMEYHSKSVHSVGMSANPYRRSGLDMTSHPLGANPLSSPSRHPSYLHGVDLTAGGGGAFPAFRYGDTRESSLLPRGNPHFPPHHLYHHLPPQSQTTSKLQMYAHPRGPPHHPHDMSEWMKAMSRSSKEMMMQPGSSPGRHKVSQSEHRHRAISHGDVPSEQHPSKVSLHHQSAYYEMKMWESAHSGREGARMIEGDPYYRAQPPPPPPLPSPAPVVSHGPVPPPMSHSQNAVEPEPPRGATEEAKHLCPPPPCSSTKPPPDVNSTQPQGQRPTKAGGAGDTNPLMLRRRVRSFISPIPAKRQLQDASQQRAATNSHHSPAAPSESSHHNDDDSSSSDLPCPRLTSPLPGESAFSQTLSPSSGNSKVLPARKGRGLKLEAIVQKITPNVKKPASHADDESNHYPGFPHSEMPTFNESQDQDLALFPRVSGADDGYMDESHSLKSMLPFRGVDEAGPVPTPAYPCDPHQTSQAIKQDFDFGLGAAVGSTPGDKEDFALLGPLPPPPPLPRPVQGSPPPSSSALSDIQHFTNTYQQLETRRGEQSAANLLRQKLQESGMGFEDYPGSDYYGTPPPHQGHMLNRQHQMSSGRSSLSPQDSKPLESVVPKGYFPSGKKKGRPVGSVNKQKRAQNQFQAQAQPQVPTQNEAQSASPAPPLPSPAAATTPSAAPPVCSTSTPTAPLPPESKDSPLLAPPVLTMAVKADVESEDAQPEVEAKPVRRRRKGVKDEDEPFEARGRQRRRRRAPVVATTSMTKDDPDTAAGGGLGTNRVYADPIRKGLFIPHIHVEKKVPEIGAVCTIVNAEEDKMKGERSAAVGKAGGSGIDSLLTSALSSQLSRRDKEAEIRETDEVESALQSGKALPSSGYVVSGPVITETNHSGRLLCCLCQKWANYKHLGDLYGPYYPAEYAAKLPKNQPQIRQCQAATGPNKTGPNSDITSNPLSATQDIQTTQQAQFTKPSAESEYSARLDSELAYVATRVPTAYPAGTNEMMMHAAGRLSHTASSSSSFTTSLTWDMHPDIRPIPELKREPDFEGDQQQQAPKQQPQQPPEVAQQRPQHRKLTSHPRFKRRHKSSDDSPRMVPSNSKASLPFQPPPPALDSLGPLAQLAQLPQMPMDPEELWVHEGCIVWTSGVYLVNGRLYGLQEALDGARETSCSYCEMVGSTLGCYSKGCTLRYHYLCSMEADCSLNEDNFSLRCPKHKFTQSIRPAKSVYLEQSERG